MIKPYIAKKTILDSNLFRNATYYPEGQITIARLDCVNEHKKKGSIFFLPGLDMSSLSIYQHALSLKDEYDIHSLVVNSDKCNNLDYTLLKNTIQNYIQASNTSFIIIGESYGGALALAVTKDVPYTMRIVINPSSSYFQSQWPTYLSSNITTLQWIHVLVHTTLQNSLNTPILSVVYNLYGKYPEYRNLSLVMLYYIFFNLTTTTLEEITCRVDNLIIPCIHDIARKKFWRKSTNGKTILLVGTNDTFLPSLHEGRKLQMKIKNSILIELHAGHVITSNELNLVDVIAIHSQ
jgi:pimeloyl-ACP methyl ester carboxylesterase